MSLVVILDFLLPPPLPPPPRTAFTFSTEEIENEPCRFISKTQQCCLSIIILRTYQSKIKKLQFRIHIPFNI